MSDGLGLTAEQRTVLHLLYAARGHLVPGRLPSDTTEALGELVDRGLVYRGLGGGWWLTDAGQTVVEAEQ